MSITIVSPTEKPELGAEASNLTTKESTAVVLRATLMSNSAPAGAEPEPAVTASSVSSTSNASETVIAPEVSATVNEVISHAFGVLSDQAENS